MGKEEQITNEFLNTLSHDSLIYTQKPFSSLRRKVINQSTILRNEKIMPDMVAHTHSPGYSDV